MPDTKQTIHINGIGVLTHVDDNEYRSEPIAVGLLAGQKAIFVVSIDPAVDRDVDSFRDAVEQFMSLDSSSLNAAAKHTYRYYLFLTEDLVEPREISEPSEVWKHVEFSDTIEVCRRGYGDRGIYVSIGIEADWASEHGLNIIFRGGSKLCRVGPQDGHLTNSDAFDDASLEDVIYYEPPRLIGSFEP